MMLSDKTKHRREVLKLIVFAIIPLYLECTDENEAIEVADKVMGMVWRKGAA
jgi:hypothetical protein